MTKCEHMLLVSIRMTTITQSNRVSHAHTHTHTQNWYRYRIFHDHIDPCEFKIEQVTKPWTLGIAQTTIKHTPSTHARNLFSKVYYAVFGLWIVLVSMQLELRTYTHTHTRNQTSILNVIVVDITFQNSTRLSHMCVLSHIHPSTTHVL